jgi:hypothetical protein
MELATMKEQEGQVSSLTAISILRSSARAAEDSAASASAVDNSIFFMVLILAQNFRMNGVM